MCNIGQAAKKSPGPALCVFIPDSIGGNAVRVQIQRLAMVPPRTDAIDLAPGPGLRSGSEWLDTSSVADPRM